VGKKQGGGLVQRVTRLEEDVLGGTQTGSLADRVAGLMGELGL
jgi:hypothetical protein